MSLCDIFLRVITGKQVMCSKCAYVSIIYSNVRLYMVILLWHKSVKWAVSTWALESKCSSTTTHQYLQDMPGMQHWPRDNQAYSMPKPHIQEMGNLCECHIQTLLFSEEMFPLAILTIQVSCVNTVLTDFMLCNNWFVYVLGLIGLGLQVR